MIDSKELRIGNLIYSESVVVAADGRTIFDLAYWEKPQYQPIPITPEWLERFGFLPYPFNGGWRHESSWLDIDNMGDYFQYPHGCAEIRSIHQLQNLYYALTGQELTIKP